MVKISYGESSYKSVVPVELNEVLDRIKTGRWKSLVLIARKKYIAGCENAAKKAKASLPVICSGIFTHDIPEGKKINRCNAAFVEASAIIVDIDHIGTEDEAGLPCDPEDIQAFKENLRDLYGREENERWIQDRVYAAWRSPSGDGLKLLFITDCPITSSDKYKALYLHITEKIKLEYGIQCDMAVHDAARETYVSYDPAIYINEQAQQIEYTKLEPMLSRESDVEERYSIKLRDASQMDIFITNNKLLGEKEKKRTGVSGFVRIMHYKEFRDMCSAFSRLGRQALSDCYDEMYNNNLGNFSQATKAALINKEKYIDSFMQPHERVPLQYPLAVAISQGFDVSKFKEKSSNPMKAMFDISDQLAGAISWMNARFAIFGCSDVLVFPRSTQVSVEQVAGDYVSDDKLFHSINPLTRWREVMRNHRLSYIAVTGKTVVKAYYDIWIESGNRRSVSKIIYDGTKPQTMPGIYNGWRGFNINGDRLDRVLKYEETEGKLVCRPIIDFIENIIGGGIPRQAKFVLDWCAELVQNPSPNNMPGVCLILVSKEQGTGKGTFDEFMRDIVGPAHSMTVNDTSQITGSFNKLLEGKLYLSLDEAFYSGDKKTAQKMKSLVASANIMIQPKFCEVYQIRNMARLVIMSNNEHVVDVEEHDRRYFFTRVSSDYATNRSYFEKLRNCWINGGKESFYNFLKNRKFEITDLDVNKVDSELRKNNRLSSMSAFDQWVVSIIRSCNIRTDDTVEMLSVSQSVKVRFEFALASYSRFCRQSKRDWEAGETVFRQRIFSSGFATECRPQLNSNGDAYISLIEIPPLKELHERFPKHADGAVLPDNDDFNF